MALWALIEHIRCLYIVCSLFAASLLLYLTCWLHNLLQKNHIFTSGASGTNAAVIRGALRAEKPELLTVILPQSLKRQPPESQELLSKVRVWLFPHGHHIHTH